MENGENETQSEGDSFATRIPKCTAINRYYRLNENILFDISIKTYNGAICSYLPI